jgi:hypothetical protein
MSGFKWLRMKLSEHGNEPSGFMKGPPKLPWTLLKKKKMKYYNSICELNDYAIWDH